MRPIRAALVLPFLASPAICQTILGDGADLQVAIDAAASGDVIELWSDGDFAFSVIDSKSLTIRAGEGFAPEITSGYSLRTQPGNTDVFVFEGLDFTSTSNPDLFFFGSLEVGARADVQYRDCSLLRLDWFDLGETDFDVTLEDCTLGSIIAGGSFPGASTGRGLQTLELFRCTQETGVAQPGVGVNQLYVFDQVLVEDCRFDGFVGFDPLGDEMTATIRRSRVTDQVFVREGATVLCESVLIDLPSNSLSLPPCGFDGDGDATLVNCTISGFDEGLSLSPTSTAENMLLIENVVDLAAGVTSSQISNSYLSGGTFDGINGNFTGTLAFGCGEALIGSTLGVDAGNSSAVGLGPLDLFGNPRIQDGDGDGIAQVNVGAIESIETFGASATVVNGNGINPLVLSALTAPVIGTGLELAIDTIPQTAATVIVLDAPAPVPFPNPVGSGEVLVALSPAQIGQFLVPGGLHSLPIPPVTSLLGNQLTVQALRVDLIGPTLQIPALNALELDFGSCN